MRLSLSLAIFRIQFIFKNLKTKQRQSFSGGCETFWCELRARVMATLFLSARRGKKWARTGRPVQCGQARQARGGGVNDWDWRETGRGRAERHSVNIIYYAYTLARHTGADSTSGHTPEPAKLASPGGEMIIFARRCLLLTVSQIFRLQIEVQPMVQSGLSRQQSACAAQT